MPDLAWGFFIDPHRLRRNGQHLERLTLRGYSRPPGKREQGHEISVDRISPRSRNRAAG
jgi:hypothetical protein